MFTRIIASVSRTLKEEELDVAQLAALYLLDERGQMRIGDVGAALDRAAPATSRLVDDLVARGFVAREEDPDDRRARVIALTAKGNKFIERTSVARVTTILETMGTLPKEVVSQFGSFVGK